MATSVPSQSAADLNIENTNIESAPGVELTEHQRLVVGSVLDLFAGRPSLRKLKLWADEAVFSDPITIARGRAQFEPQWYGLQMGFSAIERLSHTVTSSGNPISLDLQNKYTVKGIGKVQVVSSKVDIYVDSKSGLIEKVEDKWNGKLPESSIAKALRRLNAVTVPYIVSVPKTDAEDQKRGNQ